MLPIAAWLGRAPALAYVLATDQWPGSQFACTVIAILLHFLYLCTFAWALLEALHLYRALTEVRDVNAGPMRFYYMLGWGVPAFITGTRAWLAGSTSPDLAPPVTHSPGPETRIPPY
jgi:hypothetical protein